MAGRDGDVSGKRHGIERPEMRAPFWVHTHRRGRSEPEWTLWYGLDHRGRRIGRAAYEARERARRAALYIPPGIAEYRVRLVRKQDALASILDSMRAQQPTWEWTRENIIPKEQRA